MPSTSQNIQVIDLVRSLAIVLVLADHLFRTIPLPDAQPFRWISMHLTGGGAVGVFMFFVVSGYLITKIIDQGPGGLVNPGWKWFYARRVGRIIPLFLVQVFLGLFMIVVLSAAALNDTRDYIYCFKPPGDPADPVFWTSLFTFTVNWVGAFSAWQNMGAHWRIFWSLCIEEQFYLFYPILLGFLGSRSRLTRAAFYLIVACFLFKFCPFLGFGVAANASRMYVASYSLIAVGILLYLTCRRYESFWRARPGWCWLAVFLGLALLSPVFWYPFEGFTWIFRELFLGPGLFLFLLGGIHLAFFKARFLAVLALPGKYSYGIYLLHVLVLFFIHSFLWYFNNLMALFLFTAICTGVGAISYRFFEVPANRAVRKWFGFKAR